MKLTGTYTALITPFRKDQSYDRVHFEDIIEHQMSAAIDGIVVLGTTGESPTITRDEQKIILSDAVAITAGRAKVIAGSGSNSTKDSISRSRLALKCGCDAIMLVNPYYNKPTQEGLFQHFSTIAKAIDLPVLLYNIPGRTGVNLEINTLMRLVEVPNIIAIKEASGDIKQIRATVKKVPEDFTVLSGDDELTLDVLQAGGHGVVSVLSNLIPDRVKKVVDTFAKGDKKTAKSLHDKMADLCKMCFYETNPIPIKTLMAYDGFCEEVFRLPMTNMSEENKKKVISTFTRYLKKR